MIRSALLLTVVVALSMGRAAEVPLRQKIDTTLRDAWKREKARPAAAADDATFLRRAYVDLVGTIPTHDELVAFLADKDANKRGKVIEKLLADPRFARNQAEVWGLVFVGREVSEFIRRRAPFENWLAGKFAKNEPFDKVIGALLRAEEEGSQAFLVQYRGRPEDATEGVSRVLLGTQLHCARCHDHPFDPSISQRDFYGMAGFFVRLVVSEEGPYAKAKFRVDEKSTGEVLFSGSAKEARPGRKGEPIKPKFLKGDALVEPPLPKGFKEPARGAKKLPKPFFSRKEKLAEWVVAPENPFFARAVVNRVWAQFMGRGLVHPVDDLGGKNAPSLPALLDDLTKGFKEHKYDLRWLVREIVSSEAYALSHKGGPATALPKWYERARVRPLSAEELLACMRTATAFDTSGGKITGPIAEYMRIYFGKPTNGQGEFQGGLMEHLFLNNSDDLRALIRRRKGNLADAISTGPFEQRVERLFLSVLSRRPTEKEREKFIAYLKGDVKGNSRVEEAIWVLLNSSEFRFQH
jgi:hypothetical protein